MVIFWFGADLFYANVAFFAEHVHMLVHESPTPVRWLTIDATAITGFDFSAGRALAELQEDLAKKGVTLALIVVPVRHQGDLERMGLIELIGANHIFESRQACLAAYQSEWTAHNSSQSAESARET